MNGWHCLSYQIIVVWLLTLTMPLLGGYMAYVNCFSLHVAALLSLHFFMFTTECSNSLVTLCMLLH